MRFNLHLAFDSDGWCKEYSAAVREVFCCYWGMCGDANGVSTKEAASRGAGEWRDDAVRLKPQKKSQG